MWLQLETAWAEMKNSNKKTKEKKKNCLLYLWIVIRNSLSGITILYVYDTYKTPDW